MKKIPKVKIEPTELEMFKYSELVVDPYWNDLYDPKNKTDKKK